MNKILKITLLIAIFVALFVVSNNSQAATVPGCRLTAGANDTVVSFNPTSPLLSNAQPNQISKNTSVPTGKYNLSAETWDDHSGHGGQNQGLERIIFIGYDANNNEIFRTTPTTDIAEKSNWATSNLNSGLTIGSQVVKIVAKHNHIGAGNYQSVYPICLKFEKVVEVVPDPVLNGSCSINPSNLKINQSGTWKVDATGGNGNYTYTWSGTDGLSGTSREIQKTYSTTGTKNATVIVKSGSQEKTINCSTNVTDTPVVPGNPEASCSVSKTRVEIGESVTFTANVNGGTPAYRYFWTGDANGTNSTKTTSFNSRGSYRVYLEVLDANNKSTTATCATVVVDEEDEDEDEDFEIECTVSDRNIEEGDYVTFEVEIDGGNRPYEIDWKGDIDGDDEEERVRFNREGRYEVDVTVEDEDGNRRTDSCPTVRVEEEDEDDDGGVNVISRTNNTPTGNLASVDSVFLSSLPYTGPQDTAKTLGFVSLLILWSAIITKLLLNNKQKKAVSSRVQAFKEANKAKMGSDTLTN